MIKRRANKSKPQTVKAEDLKWHIDAIQKTINKRSGSKSIDTEELNKHVSAIQSTLEKTANIADANLRRSPRKRKRPSNPAPTTPERIDTADISRVPGSHFYEFTGSPTKGAKKNSKRPGKRKRDAVKIKSEPESSSESSGKEAKRAKRSRISETSDESDSDSSDSHPGESPMTRHIRIQKEILASKFSKERKTKLKNRTNECFGRITLPTAERAPDV